MFIHHLFGCGGFLVPDTTKWVSLIPYGTTLAAGCKICISLFAFVSGYGLYCSYINKDKPKKNLLRIIEFLIPYWLVTFLIAMPVLAVLHKLNMNYLPVSLFALLHNDDMLYVSFAWYVKVYLEYLLLLPLIKKLSKNIHNVWLEAIVFILLPIIISWKLPDSEATYQGLSLWIASSLRLILLWLPCFEIGAMYGKYHFRGLGSADINGALKVVSGLFLMAVAIVFTTKFVGYFQVYWISALVFVVGFDAVYKTVTGYKWPVLSWLGKYSFEYWLISGMFFLNTVELQWILFVPKYSILILVWSFLLMTPIAVVVQWISSKLDLVLVRIIHTGKSAQSGTKIAD